MEPKDPNATKKLVADSVMERRKKRKTDTSAPPNPSSSPSDDDGTPPQAVESVPQMTTPSGRVKAGARKAAGRSQPPRAARSTSPQTVNVERSGQLPPRRGKDTPIHGKGKGTLGAGSSRARYMEEQEEVEDAQVDAAVRGGFRNPDRLKLVCPNTPPRLTVNLDGFNQVHEIPKKRAPLVGYGGVTPRLGTNYKKKIVERRKKRAYPVP